MNKGPGDIWGICYGHPNDPDTDDLEIMNIRKEQREIYKRDNAEDFIERGKGYERI